MRASHIALSKGIRPGRRRTPLVEAPGARRPAACPDCGRSSDRVHDRYRRRLKDLPLAEQGFVIRLTVRRFICASTGCPRRTFAETFHALERAGLAPAGRAGARLAAQLGFDAGRMTLLRRVMTLPDPWFTTPRVLSVDDFAIRRGQTHSTVLTSVEDHRVVDVLPTGEAGPLAAWLIRHPGVEIICRDRAGAYAEGARRGAPDALQVADRFHRGQGLGRTVETCVAAHGDCLRAPTPSSLPLPDPLPASGPQKDAEPVGGPSGRRPHMPHMPHMPWCTRCSPKVTHVARSPGTCAGASAPSSGTRTPHTGRTPSATTAPDPAGWTPASPTWNADSPKDAPAHPHSAASWLPSRLPSPVAWSAPTSPPLRGGPAGAPPCARKTGRACRRSWPAVPNWTRPPDMSATSERSSPLHLLAGLTLDWSSGSIEGAVNRIKEIKRQLYARAGFELLRKMILLQ
ncbi:transposase [Streptomyces sp. NPDC085612]|uniref:transposase n=1 Tax=Streptomyces sp. NPDC085612 TaxID=3365732 RepID=UPI0037D168A3